MQRVTADKAYFIKLGDKGKWEQECLAEGVLRLGYNEVPHALCVHGRWDDVLAECRKIRSTAGAATNDKNQIRAFYEADTQTLFITFCGGKLHWCRASPGVEEADGRRLRKTIDGWHSESIDGRSLTTDRISGNLLKVQGFRGTLCNLSEPVREYLLRKINGEALPEVAAALNAERQMIDAIVSLTRLLQPKDFELLVDLVFSGSGWRRLGEIGRTQKTVDIELTLPTTGERAFVQVKSSTDDAQIDDYIEEFTASNAYSRMFYVWHTGKITRMTSPHVTLIGPEQMARMTLNAGLSEWVREKVS